MDSLNIGGQWVTALLAFFAVFLSVLCLVLVIEIVRGSLIRRSVRSRLRPLKHGGGPRPSVLATRDKGPAEGVMARISEATGLGESLRQAEIHTSLGGFILMSLGMSAGLGLASGTVASSVLFQVPWVALGGGLPYAYVAFKRHRRMRAFEEKLPEAIDLLARAIRAGHPLSSGIQMVGDEAQEPVAKEFRTIFDEQRFGIPFDEALMGLLDRVDMVDVRIFVTAVLVQREVGGNLAEVLDNIAHTMRSRFSIRRQLRVYTAQGRMSGYVLAVMPFIVGLGLWTLDKDYMGSLFFTVLGRFMLAFSFILWLFGFFWIRKIVNIEI